MAMTRTNDHHLPESPPSKPRTLRDEFAMAALTGICASPLSNAGVGTEKIAQAAYEVADEMLIEREIKR
jgi:hypothetical protein